MWTRRLVVLKIYLGAGAGPRVRRGFRRDLEPLVESPESIKPQWYRRSKLNDLGIPVSLVERLRWVSEVPPEELVAEIPSTEGCNEMLRLYATRGLSQNALAMIRAMNNSEVEKNGNTSSMVEVLRAFAVAGQVNEAENLYNVYDPQARCMCVRVQFATVRTAHSSFVLQLPNF